jgi:hypothetical protein
MNSLYNNLGYLSRAVPFALLYYGDQAFTNDRKYDIIYKSSKI